MLKNRMKSSINELIQFRGSNSLIALSVCLLGFLVSCDFTRNHEDIMGYSNNQIDSVLLSKHVETDLIRYTSYDEKKEVLSIENMSIDSLKYRLNVFKNKREGILKRAQVLDFYNKGIMPWDIFLDENEKKHLQTDQAAYWLKYFNRIKQRKSKFSFLSMLKDSEIQEWLTDGMNSTMYYDSIAVERWLADSSNTVNLRQDYHNIMNLNTVLHPVDFNYPFGSSSIDSLLGEQKWKKLMHSENTDYFKIYEPLFIHDNNSESESIGNHRFLPLIKTRTKYWTDKRGEDLYQESLDDIKTNPGEYFNYRLDDIGSFEVYLYTLPYETIDLTENNEAYLTLYNRSSQVAYTIRGLSKKDQIFPFISSEKIVLFKKVLDDTGEYLFKTHEFTVYRNGVYINEFLPFPMYSDLYKYLDIKDCIQYFQSNYSQKYMLKSFMVYRESYSESTD